MTDPAQVLDRQAELIERSGTAAWAEYMQAYNAFRSNVTGDSLAAVNVDAYKRALRGAYAYHVATSMVPLVVKAGRELPDDTCLTMEDLPTPQGFMWFDETIEQRATTVVPRLRAVLWSHGVGEVEGADGRRTRKPGVALAFFTDLDARSQATSVRMYDTDGKTLRHLSKQELRERYGRIMLLHGEFVPYGMQLGSPIDLSLLGDGREGVTETPVRPWLSALLLMGQTIADVAEEEVDRSARRRARRMGLPPRVTVIQLRRRQHSGRSGDGSPVEWQHCWVVRGHWRNQPYGTGRTKRKMIYIHPHTKGNTDGPLIVSDKVYTLVR